jgi:hypothetical protein
MTEQQIQIFSPKLPGWERERKLIVDLDMNRKPK